MSSWAVPALLAASVPMALLVLIPRRLWYFQVPAVLGWAAVWLDNDLSAQWADLAGLAVVTVSLAALPLVREPRRGQ